MTTQDDDDDTPRDLDELRIRLARRIANLYCSYAQCDARTCRRARRCVDAALPCAQQLEPSVADDEDDAQIKAELHIALRARMAEQGSE